MTYFLKLLAFLRTQTFLSALMLFVTVLALFMANSGLNGFYVALIQQNLFGLSLQHWINDGLMAIFFFVIGMEIKKEVLVGELSDFKRASLPLLGALGGMVVPATIYLLIANSSEMSRGWGIPMATDIAFALACLALFRNKVPVGLKVFLLALAIVDDLGAVLVIALFYTQKIHLSGLLFAGFMLWATLFFKKIHVRKYWIYGLLGLGVWVGFLFSGVHATIAGVIMGLITPLEYQPPQSLRRESIIDNLSHLLHPWVSYLIIPLFAFANAGVTVPLGQLGQLLGHTVTLAVTAGLLIGKPLGILGFCFLFKSMGWVSLPRGVSWGQMTGVACLAGIGFTMSIFISNLAFGDGLITYAKVGILVGSLVSAVLGVIILSQSRGLPSSLE